MGVVVEARDRYDGRHVALKMPRTLALLQPESVERFRREAATMASLRHPNIIEFLGFFESPPVIVLELLQGESVATTLRRERVLPLHVAALHGMQICGGLAAAHAASVIHRDVKPSNLFVQQLPGQPTCAKLIDFGVAKHTERDAAPLTAQSAIVGSALYLSPEQIRGEPAQERSDLFALGLCLYEMVTGERPYAEGTLHLAMVRILQGDPLPPHPALPAGLHTTLLRATSREPAARFQSAEEFARALHPFSKKDIGRTQMSPVVSAPDAAPGPIRISSVPPPPDSVTRLDHPREVPSSSRYGTTPMHGVRSEDLKSTVPFYEPSPASMTAPLAPLPPELAARLAAAAPPPSRPVPFAARPLSSYPPPAAAPPPSSGTWKVAVGVSAVAVAAGLAGAGYWLGVHRGEEGAASPSPTPSGPVVQPPAAEPPAASAPAAAPTFVLTPALPVPSAAPKPGAQPKADPQPKRKPVPTARPSGRALDIPTSR